MTLFDLLPWLLGIAIGALVWWHTLGARTIARRAARQTCRDHGVYFIDELAFRRLSLGRGRHGRGWRVRRHYDFEFYSRGDRRYSGCVDMVGLRVERVQLGPHPEPGDSS